jgi:class 3 adenylate cyclase
MEIPDVRYARSGDVSIAYQVVGEGPVDLVFVPFMGNLIYAWVQPRLAQFYRRLASFSRLIVLDKRGTGLSDRPRILSLEAQMDDVRAVLDDVGSERAALFGSYSGGQVCALFAATYPERASALLLYNTQVGPGAGGFVEAPSIVRARWGSREFMESLVRGVNPSLSDDREHIEWDIAYRRLSASPSAAYAFYRMLEETDITDVLPAIGAPTLVLHRVVFRDDAFALERGIRNARRIEVPGIDHHTYIGDEIVLEAQKFLTGVVDEPVPERVLATVVFTDIVGSTEHAARLGDRRWRELLYAHHEVIRRELARHRGTEVDTTGDGFFATFEGPARGISCARAAAHAVRALGLELRAGVHTGEFELVGGRPHGIAVHIGARLAEHATPGEVLVSGTVKDLVAGSGLEFEDRGSHELKGVPGEWRLYAVRDS